MCLPEDDGRPVIVAPTTTPFRPDETIDHALLAANVERWNHFKAATAKLEIAHVPSARSAAEPAATR